MCTTTGARRYMRVPGYPCVPITSSSISGYPHISYPLSTLEDSQLVANHAMIQLFLVCLLLEITSLMVLSRTLNPTLKIC
ncbi:hypothetical protein V8C42DRAFT_316375 [Trichoderma barbatum]